MRTISLWAAAVSCLALSSAQSANVDPISPDVVETILTELNILPKGLVDAAATLLAGLANDAQQAIVDTLKNNTLSDERKLTDPEAYYSYGHSPAVYPARELSQLSTGIVNILLTCSSSSGRQWLRQLVQRIRQCALTRLTNDRCRKSKSHNSILKFLELLWLLWLGAASELSRPLPQRRTLRLAQCQHRQHQWLSRANIHWGELEPHAFVLAITADG
jgi:hypothetical protein